MATEAEGGRHYSNIILGGKERSIGELGASSAGFKWRARATGKMVSVAPSDMRGFGWGKVRGGCALRVQLKGGTSLRFEGFRAADREAVAALCKEAFGHDLEDFQTSTKGLNWGAARVEGASVTFSVDEAGEAFEVPLSEVAQATLQGKHEVALEFHVADTLAPEDESVVEMRFHIPPKGAGGDEDEDEDEGAVDTGAERFLEQVVSKADLAISGETIASLDDVAMVVPRGRYEVELFPAFMSLHGKTYDYKVMYSSVMALYSLPKADNYHVNLAVHLDPPIRQGATYYQFLVLQFPVEEMIDLQLSMEPKLLNEKFGGRLPRRLQGPAHEVVSQLFCGLTGKKSHDPAPAFKSASGQKSVRCAYKANDAYLFAFERAFFVNTKPPQLVPFDSIAAVEFSRVDKSSAGASSKMFDMILHKRGGDQMQLGNMHRNEYQPLFNFLISKKLRIKNIHKGGDLGDEEGAGRGRGRDEAEAELDDDDEDEDADSDDEEDEDFAGGDDSDVDEEFEEDDCSDDDEAAGSKRKKGKKGKKAADAEEEEDEAEEGGDAPAKGKGKQGSPGKKKRAKKDPDAPKRPMTAFLLFSNELRPQMMAAQPQMSVPEVGKALGERWRSATAEDKAKFEEQAAKLKEQYDAKMEEYKANKGKGGAGPSKAADSGGAGKAESESESESEGQDL